MGKKFCAGALAFLLAVSCIGTVTLAAEEKVITPHDQGCTLTGEWAESMNEAVKGPTGLTSFYGTGTVTYSAEGLTAGSYDVYVYNIPFGSTPDAVQAEVVGKDGGKQETLDYSAAEAGWLKVGSYAFSGKAGEGVTFSVLPQSSVKVQRAIALRFAPVGGGTASAPVSAGGEVAMAGGSGDPAVIPPGGELIMGSGAEGFSMTGNWDRSSLKMPSQQSSYYTYGNNATATWRPNLAKQDNVTVYYMKAAATDKEDPAVQFEIYAEGKTTKVMLDITQGDNGWMELGTFSFAGDNSEYIKLTKVTPEVCTRITDLRFTAAGQGGEEGPASALAGTDEEILERLGMLLGEGDGVTEEYLATVPTRVQAAVLVLRLRGLEEAAEAYTSEDNFADWEEANWAKNVLAYIKAHPEYGMVGTGNNAFEPNSEIDGTQYAKILLEALGYAYGEDFTWEETRAAAARAGISVKDTGKFTIGDLAEATAAALELPLKGEEHLTMLSRVITEREGIQDDEYLKDPQEMPENLQQEQLALRHKERGLIYNDDGNDTYVAYPEYPNDFDISGVTEPMTRENFLSKRTVGVEDSQVSTIMYCTGVFNSYTHRTSGETTVRKRDWSWTLADSGPDTIETKLDFCRKNGIEMLWSMRMNDCHDRDYEENQLDPWKQEHLDWLMGRKYTAIMTLQYGPKYWSAVDYGVPQVRQKVYNIVKDTMTRYDVDGIELDFTRFPLYFKQVCQSGEVWPESIERMNNLMRSIRTLLNQLSIQRNKPLMLTVYVPDSQEFCKALGLDVREWLEEDMLDMVAVRSTLAIQSWEDSVAEYAPYDVPLNAALDPLLAFEPDSQPDLNKEAALAYRAGMDGIEIYNVFNPKDPLFDTLGSPKTCGPVDPGYKSKFKQVPEFGMLVKDSQRFIKPIPY